MDTKLDETRVDEKRKAPRHRTLKAGSVRFNRSAGIDCRVRNLSLAGACLEVTSQFGIPEDFVLVIDVDQLSRSCHVIWRTATRMGVAFGG